MKSVFLLKGMLDVDKFCFIITNIHLRFIRVLKRGTYSSISEISIDEILKYQSRRNQTLVKNSLKTFLNVLVQIKVLTFDFNETDTSIRLGLEKDVL